MWLPRDIVLEHMPTDFREKYPATRVILDATECFIQKPGRVQDQSATWSSYKNHNTIKAMIGISPRGQVTHVSDAYGGATSDRQVTFVTSISHFLFYKYNTLSLEHFREKKQ